MPSPAVGAARWAALGVTVAAAGGSAAAAAAGEDLSVSGLLARASGGPLTVRAVHRDALLTPPPGIAPALEQQRARGEAFFNTPFVAAAEGGAEGVASVRDGLGPFFNAAACDNCHNAARRGPPPAPGSGHVDGDGGVAMVVQSSVIDAAGRARPHPRYGRSITAGAVTGVTPEGRMRIAGGSLADGRGPDSAGPLAPPRYRIDSPGYGPLGEDAVLSVRIAPSLAGMGLIEAIPQADLLLRADPDDRDGDGISGRANVVGTVQGRLVVGRFGWKASEPTLESQTASAFLDEMGITSALRPQVDCAPAQQACRTAPEAGRPELAAADLDAVVTFQRLLPVPARALPADAATAGRLQRGAALFARLACSACHVPAFVTAADARPAPLAGQVIHPFSDFLLHDMGPGLADGRPERAASGSEWRTPPLWGLGLARRLGLAESYLHDARARSLEEAILWHAGEAGPSAAGFRWLAPGQRADLLAFLESL